jgi:hypothetical protein
MLEEMDAEFGVGSIVEQEFILQLLQKQFGYKINEFS